MGRSGADLILWHMCHKCYCHVTDQGGGGSMLAESRAAEWAVNGKQNRRVGIDHRTGNKAQQKIEQEKGIRVLLHVTICIY